MCAIGVEGVSMFAILQSLFALVVGLMTAVIPPWSVQRGDRPSESALPPALVAMADAERAFSRRASETTPRQAFIEFFADESVSFQPDPGPARERLRTQPPPKPGQLAFQWEPRTGDVAASGDLGYLTGPVRYPQPDGSVRHGCYFSVWKKQADGTFKVILDVGVQPPAEVPFAPGFVRAPGRATGSPRGSRADAERGLLEADKAFSAAIAGSGAAAAFRAVMHEGGRLHRNGFLPPTTRAAAVTWLESHVTSMTSEPMKSETGASGDLGYTWGRAVVTGPDGKPNTGYYVRLWTLGDGGRWQLVADITPG
jgi:ketosteroid isomerase-like protein